MRSALALPLALPLASILIAVPLAAQPADSTAAHEVPFGSSGNTLELAVANASAESLVGVTVAVAEAPPWLRVSPSSAPFDPIAPGEEAVASLTFDVGREAPVGEPADVRLVVRTANGDVLQTKEVRLRVGSPQALALLAPRPNPARSVAMVPFELPAASRVRLAAYDVLGREVAVLVDADRGPGAHEARLETAHLAAGTYVVRLLAEGERPEARVVRLTVVR